MKYTKLGKSELKVFRICMGCMGFGDPERGQHSWTIDEEQTKEIIKRGLDLGVNFYLKDLQRILPLLKGGEEFA